MPGEKNFFRRRRNRTSRPTMMVAAALQAVKATKPCRQELVIEFCTWVDKEFRKILGDKADWLLPPPDEAW